LAATEGDKNGESKGAGPAVSDQRITSDGATIILMVAPSPWDRSFLGKLLDSPDGEAVRGPFTHRHSYFLPPGAVTRGLVASRTSTDTFYEYVFRLGRRRESFGGSAHRYTRALADMGERSILGRAEARDAAR